MITGLLLLKVSPPYRYTEARTGSLTTLRLYLGRSKG
jgi:hypothetical protein